MTKDPKGEQAQMSAVDDFILDEILSASDEEVLARMQPDDASRADAALSRARAAVGKLKMAEIRAAVEVASTRPKVVKLDPGRAARELERLRSADSTLKGRTTLAARKASGEIAADDEGLLDDLNELLSDDRDQA